MSAKKTTKTAKPAKTTKTNETCADEKMPEFGPPGALLGWPDDAEIASATPDAVEPEAVEVAKAAPKTKIKKTKSDKLAGASLTSLAAICNDYLASLIGDGKSVGTARSYAADVAVLLRELGAETEIATISEAQVAAYFESDAVTRKRDGSPKDAITVAKIRRIARQVFRYAEEVRVISVAPLPEKANKAG